MSNIETPPAPRLEQIKCELANLTGQEARFLRGVIRVVTHGGMTLDSLRRGEVALVMAASGECVAHAVKSAPFYTGKN